MVKQVPSPIRGLDKDSAAMRFNDFLDDRQTQARRTAL